MLLHPRRRKRDNINTEARRHGIHWFLKSASPRLRVDVVPWPPYNQQSAISNRQSPIQNPYRPGFPKYGYLSHRSSSVVILGSPVSRIHLSSAAPRFFLVRAYSCFIATLLICPESLRRS